MTIKFLLVVTHIRIILLSMISSAQICSWQSKNVAKMKKTEELSGANLENATFANLFSSRVFKYYTNVAYTSFALNLLLSIHILATYLLRANFICANTFFRSVLKQQL